MAAVLPGQATGGARDRRAPRSWEAAVPPRRELERLAECALATAHGFLVDLTTGEEVGVVTGVELDDRTGAALALEVAAGRFGGRRLVIGCERIREVWPRERRLVVAAAGRQTALPGLPRTAAGRGKMVARPHFAGARAPPGS